jgi:8-oxo-dGTP pyrophosphatase MutT (NUDIX family)
MCPAPARPPPSRTATGRGNYDRGVPDGHRPRVRRPSRRRPRPIEETSAGGLVVDLSDGAPRAALIARRARDGGLLWSLPKGHVEPGETNEETALREIKEETGIVGRIVRPIGSIDYWFVFDNRRIHKTVHHFLVRATGGELTDTDVEVEDVAWVSFDELSDRLAYPNERDLVRSDPDLLAGMT